MSRLRADKVLNKNATGPFEASEGIVIPEDKILTIGTNGGDTGEYLRRSSTGMTWGNIPTASQAEKGVIQVGVGLNISDGILNTDFDSKLSSLIDVDLSTPPIIGQVLKWDGEFWIPETDASGANAADRLKNTTAPTAADDPGTAGEVRYDADYIYVCVATNTWKRVLIETWV